MSGGKALPLRAGGCEARRSAQTHNPGRVSSPYAGAGPAVDRPGLRGGRVWQIGLPSWVAPLPGIPESPVVVEARLVLAGFPVGVPVPLVEPAGAGVSAVDIDLEHFAAALPGSRLGRHER